MKKMEKRIDTILNEKINAMIESFQAQRETDLEELISLEKGIQFQEAEKKRLTEEQRNLNVVREEDKARSWEIVLDLRSIEEKLVDINSEIEALVEKLTAVPSFEKNPALLNFLMELRLRRLSRMGQEKTLD